MNPRPNDAPSKPAAAAAVVMRPGPIEGSLMMAVGALVLGLAFLTQVDGYSGRDLARSLLPGAPEMAESGSTSVGL